MTQEKRLSDEFLNAFVDNQLAAEEKSRAYIEINRDESLNRQVCELRKLHDLVQLAYGDVESPTHRRPGAWRHRLRFGIAASVLLALGVALGMALDAKLKAPEPAEASLTTLAPTPNIAALTDRGIVRAESEDMALSRYTPVPARSAADAAVSKVLVHITYDDSARIDQALQDIEGLLHYYRESNQLARVEIVTNGHGINLLRADTSRHARRIAALQKEFDNLTFAACQNTLDRMKRETNMTVRLLPGVVVIDSGMAEIMRRQDQGWAYLQV